MSRLLNIWKDGGQSLIEVSLTVPILLLILVAAAEAARVGYASIEVMNAASAGVKYGAQNPNTATDTNGIQTAAQNDAANITLSGVSVNTSCICSDNTGCSATKTCATNPETILYVTTTTTFDPGFHLPGFSTSFTLTGTAVQKVLQ